MISTLNTLSSSAAIMGNSYFIYRNWRRLCAHH